MAKFGKRNLFLVIGLILLLTGGLLFTGFDLSKIGLGSIANVFSSQSSGSITFTNREALPNQTVDGYFPYRILSGALSEGSNTSTSLNYWCGKVYSKVYLDNILVNTQSFDVASFSSGGARYCYFGDGDPQSPSFAPNNLSFSIPSTINNQVFNYWHNLTVKTYYTGSIASYDSTAIQSFKDSTQTVSAIDSGLTTMNGSPAEVYFEPKECAGSNLILAGGTVTAGNTVSLNPNSQELRLPLSDGNVVLISQPIFCSTTPLIKIRNDQIVQQSTLEYKSLVNGGTVTVPTGEVWLMFWRKLPSTTLIPSSCVDSNGTKLYYNEVYNQCKPAPSFSYFCGLSGGTLNPTAGACIAQEEPNCPYSDQIFNTQTETCQKIITQSNVKINISCLPSTEISGGTKYCDIYDDTNTILITKFSCSASSDITIEGNLVVCSEPPILGCESGLVKEGTDECYYLPETDTTVVGGTQLGTQQLTAFGVMILGLAVIIIGQLFFRKR